MAQACTTERRIPPLVATNRFPLTMASNASRLRAADDPSMVSEHWLTTRTANITINVGIGHEMTAGRRRGRLCLSGGMSKPRASVYLRSTASLSTHDQKYLRDFHQTRPSVTMGRSNVLPRKSLQRQLRKAARNTVSRWCVSTREFITR